MSTAVPALVASFGAVAHAGGLPTGGQVVGGSATITTPSATHMQITSTTTRSAISWSDFSIGSGYGVNVTQPNGGTQLESVRGTNVSQIFGSLTSNGSIVIANPNGIWFGPNAQVDVAGLAAVAANPSAADTANFIKGGSLNLSQAGAANAAVVNQGTISISNAGLAAFVAPGVRNDGVIAARLGTVQLSSGTTATLDFYGDGLISIAVSGQ
ncbi:MAG: filamentous hemagglutinin N-terminal domain-containing protein, partial [Stellaceae bacterium]